MFIILVNIIGGLLIGLAQKGLTFNEAAVTYTILTVGDGLVTQIPALIISTAAGILVSRAGGETPMGQEFLSQFTLNPVTMTLTGVIIFGLGLLPGLPHIPFILLGGLLVALSFYFRKEKVKEDARRAKAKEEARAAETQAAAVGAMSPEQVEALLPLDIMELEVGYGLIPLVDEEQNGDLLDRIRSIRQQLALEMGIVVPPLHVRDNLQLKAGAYSILVKGNEVAHGELMIDYLLAMDPGDVKKTIDGIETREPAFNLPAIWIHSNRREEAQFAGYSVVDISTVIATHLTEVIRSHAEELLGRQEVQKLIDNLAKTAPKPVEEMMHALSLGVVQKVLQHLLRERVSIRDLLTISETLADYGPMTKDVELLTEYCRQKLSRGILKHILGVNNRDLHVLTVDPRVEDVITGGLQQTDQGVYLSLEPERVQSILNGISQLLEKFAPLAQPPVVLCSPVVRRHLRKIIERFVPTLAVLSHNELAGDINVHSVGTVQLTEAAGK
jgi:flagellar biosynthesis protein FlhA